MKEILVDEAGYRQYFEELDRLKVLAKTIAQSANEACDDAVGDGWHDNFAFEEFKRQSEDISLKIKNMLENQRYLKIVNDEVNKDCVNIGNIFLVKFIYSDNDIEEEFIKLTGKYLPASNLKIKEISLNSPLGKAVYGKKKDSITSYFVGDKEIKIHIQDIMQ